MATRVQQRAQAEDVALRLLANSRTWVGTTALAETHGENWRVLARALSRLAGRGIIAERRVEVPRSKGRVTIRREYRLQSSVPLLVMMPKFDPAQLNIVGVRVVRCE